MEKLVVKTAVKTVLVILGVLVAVFTVFNFAFPQHMATLTESMGNYSIAVNYAALRYSYTGDGEDLARCFDDAYLLGNDKLVVQYGEELSARKDFEKVCEKRTEKLGGNFDYRTVVLSRVAVSKYRTGAKQESVDLAAEANGEEGFANHNPLVSLAAAARKEGDAETCKKLIEKISAVKAKGAEQDYQRETIAILDSFVKENTLK